MFKSKKEFAQALMEGRKFRTAAGGVIYYDDNSQFPTPFCYKAKGHIAEPLEDEWNQFDIVTEILEPQWYEDIPKEGVLCRVYDEKLKDETPVRVKIHIVRYCETNTNDEYRFGVGGYIGEGFNLIQLAWYRYAEPLTLEEVKSLTYQKKETI